MKSDTPKIIFATSIIALIVSFIFSITQLFFPQYLTIDPPSLSPLNTTATLVSSKLESNLPTAPPLLSWLIGENDTHTLATNPLSDYKVLGISWVKNFPKLSRAIISKVGGETRSYKTGDIPSLGLTLVQITEQEVFFKDQNGEITSLKMSASNNNFALENNRFSNVNQNTNNQIANTTVNQNLSNDLENPSLLPKPGALLDPAMIDQMQQQLQMSQ